MAVMAETISAKDEEIGQSSPRQDSVSEEASEANEEPAGEAEAEEDCSEEADSPAHVRDTEEAVYEAFSELSAADLKEIAKRLTKCNEGFQEMLHEAEDEQEQLMRESAELNERISHAMQDIHRKEHKPAATKTVEVAAEVGQKAVNRLQRIHKSFVNKANDQLNGLVDQGADLIQIAKRRHAEAVAARAERQAAAQKRAQKKRKEPKAKKEKVKKAAESVASELEKPAAATPEKVVSGKGAATLKDVVLKKQSVQDPLAEKEKVATVVNTIVPEVVLKKTKPILSTDATVVIEAKVVVTDGTAHLLEVRMTDSCEEAGRRFIEEHKQRKWFEEPLIAWLKCAEADAVKLPLRVEAELTELRKQYAKDAKAAQAQAPKSA